MSEPVIDWSKATVTVKVPVLGCTASAIQEFDIPLVNLLIMAEFEKKKYDTWANDVLMSAVGGSNG